MNVKLKLLDIALCRTPAFGVDDLQEKNVKELKEMILYASSSFSKIIQDLDSDEMSHLSEKIKFSIWKYFNRARYRATPYGRFAAFSLLPVLNEENLPPTLNSEMSSHQFIDWTEKDDIIKSSTTLHKDSNWFQINTTIYKFGNDYRYLRMKDGVFEIATIDSFPELTFLLFLCRKKTSKEILYLEMERKFQLHRRAIDGLLLQMISLQILLTDKCPNITGEDYFVRTDIKKKSNPGTTYIIAERKISSGGLDSRKLQHVPELIGFLSKYLPTNTNPSLKDFRSAFLKKFDQRAIPLTIAMDIEAGVGYNNLGEQMVDNGFADFINMSEKKAGAYREIPYTDLHKFLIDNLMKGGVIKLEEFDGWQSEYSILPNTLSVLFHLWHGQPVLQHIGGCTANTLLGRFTIASKELEEFGQKIASLEELSNPDVLFFDIAYHAEKEIDNVNRRKQLYKYELPILNWSCSSSPLHLDDILVAVRGKEILLWSKKYQKRMVPRISSAYNYNRSDLAVFRFLSDIQHYQIRSDLSFKVHHFFPDLSFYPRVMFKGIVVSPAMWKLPQEIINIARTGTLEDGKTALITWLHREGIDFLFKSGHADQMLCFNPCIDIDRVAFILHCRQNAGKAIYILEALVANEDNLQGNDGKKYIAEIIASYSHQNRVYEPLELKDFDITNETPDERFIFPGEDWLYFELYCHPITVNRILIKQIAEFLKANKGKIVKWFFIRYDDPKPHIRLRLNLKDATDGYTLISQLKSLLEFECKNGIISEIQIKTYIREIERYKPFRMELIENLFFADSKFILRILSRTVSMKELYAAVLMMMQSLIALVFGDIHLQLSFSKSIADQFSKEMDMNHGSFKKINLRFKELTTSLNLDRIFNVFRLPVYLTKTFLDVVSNCDDKDAKKKLLTDIIHLHINRLLDSDQRIHEAVLYHYLFKILSRRANLIVPKEH
ncbi:lantibiotic dehydratase [Mucilaginibacter sp. FT3.2]|uniref:lantibiotic dehydratase n=1 Tax=Mucilaginibacter sp. FT3.2 TaxID=2723090 RepID=UPI0016074927|nr:lantibiotic dehydratase [Mucilaginibacter sp. FT3.2]MBB6232724.1 thiopeptide-type bacteriocin biosynthesis protein [Mucilaginibacter sp. FT3.2]